MKKLFILLIFSVLLLPSCEKKWVRELEFSYINYKNTSDSLYKQFNLKNTKYIELKKVSIDFFKNNLNHYYEIKDSVLYKQLINNTFINGYYERDSFNKQQKDLPQWSYQKHLQWMKLNKNKFHIIGKTNINKNTNSTLLYFQQSQNETYTKDELNNLYPKF